VNELTLIGSRCGRFEPALNLLQSRSINVAAMISETVPLSQSRHAFSLARRRGILKVLLKPD
jgi:threonine dehydrogenase-like Zn-dependent dehydrogenase